MQNFSFIKNSIHKDQSNLRMNIILKRGENMLEIRRGRSKSRPSVAIVVKERINPFFYQLQSRTMTMKL